MLLGTIVFSVALGMSILITSPVAGRPAFKLLVVEGMPAFACAAPGCDSPHLGHGIRPCTPPSWMSRAAASRVASTPLARGAREN